MKNMEQVRASDLNVQFLQSIDWNREQAWNTHKSNCYLEWIVSWHPMELSESQMLKILPIGVQQSMILTSKDTGNHVRKRFICWRRKVPGSWFRELI